MLTLVDLVGTAKASYNPLPTHLKMRLGGCCSGALNRPGPCFSHRARTYVCVNSAKANTVKGLGFGVRLFNLIRRRRQNKSKQLKKKKKIVKIVNFLFEVVVADRDKLQTSAFGCLVRSIIVRFIFVGHELKRQCPSVSTSFQVDHAFDNLH